MSGRLELWLINGKKVLNSAHANYSFDSLHILFQKVFQDVHIVQHPPKHVLILGFGCGSVAHILQREYRFDCTITGVDLDPLMLQIAETHFGIKPSETLALFVADAQTFVAHHTHTYDWIVVDLFVDDSVPATFTENKFLAELTQLLAPNGHLLMNMITSHPEGKRQLALLEAYFSHQRGELKILAPISENTVVYFQRYA